MAPSNQTDTKAREQILLPVVHPRVRDRWMGPVASQFTPTRIEQVLRSTASGSLLAQWELFNLMEETWPRLTKNLNELKRAVISLNWGVQPWADKGNEPDQLSQDKARFLEDAVWRMQPKPEGDENDFEDTIRDILDAWGKGISVLEIDWATGTQGQLGIVPRNTRWIHPLYYGYPPTGSDLMINVREVNQMMTQAERAQAISIQRSAGLDGYVPFPPDKFLISICKAKTGHPVGAALLRPLAFWWAAHNFTTDWFLNFVQIFGIPFRWANYDPSASKATIDLICDMLENMGSAAWGAFPAGTMIEFKEASRTGSNNPHKVLLDTADSVCDILILGQTLTTDAGDRGTQALGRVHMEVRQDIIDAAANFVSKVLNNQLVPALIAFNFGNRDELPYFMPAAEEVQDAKVMAERDQILLDSGVKIPSAWFYERHDIPMPRDGEEVIGKPEEPEKEEGKRIKEQQDNPAKAVHAKDATDQLIDRVLEDLTGVQARWLGGVKPFFARLIQAAGDENVSDEDFIRAVEAAQGQFPELFRSLDMDALADSMERAMGAAVVNGAVAGHLQRRGKEAAA